MTDHGADLADEPVRLVNARGTSSVVLVCEHASNHIPASFAGLGLSADARESHAAWDIGAAAVAERLAAHLDAILVAGGVSRLVYDCNRPPTAPDAMPKRSEVFDIPGNANLSDMEKSARVQAIYAPFHRAVSSVIARTADPVIITIHSFTHVYHGQKRAVEIGILHDTDTRFADAMLDTAKRHTSAQIQRNAPYGPDDGVTHTLTAHGLRRGHPNVMIEIRNDLIQTASAQDAIAFMLAKWIADAFAQTGLAGVVQCRG